ncbi:MAG: VTT domain-containing protein [Methanobacterium sp.]|uniref:DedA family protein n=1 Tax=Methanobacterium sp. TaxID=2164 RepID=UPI003D660DD9|nr:VTT domain-containing protein [Methanobacterium sp.]
MSIMSIIEGFFLNYGLLGVFLGSITEQVIAPIPSSIVVLGSSFIVMKGTSLALGSLSTLFFIVSIPAAAGVTIGSLVYYFISYKVGMPFVERAGKYLGVSVEDIQNVEKRVKESRYDHFFLFGARCLPIIPSIAVNLFCGLIKYPLRNYLVITFFGALIQATILGIVGWQVGNFYISLADNISFLNDIIAILIVLIVVLYVIKKRREKGSKKEE